MNSGADNLDRATDYTLADTEAKIANLLQGVRKAQSLPSLTECKECGETIPQARQKAVKGGQCCFACQEALDIRAKGYRA